MSLSFPRHLSDNPSYLNFGSERGRVLYGEDLYVGYRYYDTVGRPALFPFGHGLSYTTFAFSGLDVNLESDESIRVTLKVENTGPRAGAEVIQIYIAAVSPSIKRPPKELKQFEKVHLSAGESTNVVVSMELKYATSFWDEESHDWIQEAGRYNVLVGNSSRCDFLEAGFEVQETRHWKGL